MRWSTVTNLFVEEAVKTKILRVEPHSRHPQKHMVVQQSVGTVFISSRLGFDGKAECYAYVRQNTSQRGDNPKIART
jgi:hypothetical protein